VKGYGKMSKQKRQRRNIKQTPVAALYAALREGRLSPLREVETFDASHTPTMARLFGRGFKRLRGQKQSANALTANNSRKELGNE